MLGTVVVSTLATLAVQVSLAMPQPPSKDAPGVEGSRPDSGLDRRAELLEADPFADLGLVVPEREPQRESLSAGTPQPVNANPYELAWQRALGPQVPKPPAGPGPAAGPQPPLGRVNGNNPGGSNNPSGKAPRSIADELGFREDLSLMGSSGATRLGSGTPHMTMAEDIFSVVPILRAPQLIEIELTNIGTGWVETALLRTPALPLSNPKAPLLVTYHAYGRTPLSIPAETEYFREGFERGWYVLAPLGAAAKNYSSIPSQINTEAVLNFVLSQYNIDTDRIYGVGFSMGGANVANYAARHLDPANPMFAAIVNHSGGTSQRDAYLNTDPSVHWEFEFWFGGPPAAEPFNYQRSSVIDLVLGVVDPETDLARNLTHVPVLNWSVDNDPLGYVVTHTDAFHNHLMSLGGNSTRSVVPGTTHEWTTLPEEAACDFLEQHSLSLPAGASTLADQDGPYFFFDIQQDAAGSFTPFTWGVNTQTNSVVVRSTENLARATVDTLGAGLDPLATLTLTTGIADVSADEIVFSDYPNVPGSVLKDGISNPNWTYDPQIEELVIQELDGAGHTWLIVP